MYILIPSTNRRQVHILHNIHKSKTNKPEEKQNQLHETKVFSLDVYATSFDIHRTEEHEHESRETPQLPFPRIHHHKTPSGL